MKISFENSSIKPSGIEKTLKRVSEYENCICSETPLCLLFDNQIIESVEKTVKQFLSKKLKYVVVIGIGGSNLGAQAIYSAMRGPFDFFEPKTPKLLFLDTISDKNLNSVATALEKTKEKTSFLIIVISKSGTTMETTVNYEQLKTRLEEKFDNIDNRTVVITDKGSRLWKTAEKLNIAKLAIPKQVGGRYSVFSAVGLFPLALCGFDLEAFIDGAKQVDTDSAAKSACLTYFQAKKGLVINNLFIFAPELEYLGKWFRQLMAESLGKDGKGVTPIISIGSTDLHSMGQLYCDGPKDKFTCFLTDKSQSKIMSAIANGTKNAYKKLDLPFIEIELDSVCERELGCFMQFRMMETVLLARLFNVNAFDQPAVEHYKSETKALLK